MRERRRKMQAIFFFLCRLDMCVQQERERHAEPEESPAMQKMR